MSITWNRAAKLCGADTKELKDWPERLSIEQAAIFAAGNRAADFMDALEAMREAIEQGDLPAEDAERPREVRMLLREPDRFEVLAAGSCKMVAAGDVLAWLDEQGQDPGEHVRAWGKGCDAARAEYSRAFDLLCRLDETKAEAKRLRAAAGRTTGQERESNIRQAKEAEAEVSHLEAALRGEELPEAKEGDATPAKQHKTRGRKPSDAPALLVQILDALESYAATTGQDFDRHTMPGPLGESADDKGSFHWLCARLHPRTFKRAADTFAKHRAGLCAVAPYAKPTDFYRLALPHIAPKLGVTLNVHHMPKQGRKLA